MASYIDPNKFQYEPNEGALNLGNTPNWLYEQPMISPFIEGINQSQRLEANRLANERVQSQLEQEARDRADEQEIADRIASKFSDGQLQDLGEMEDEIMSAKLEQQRVDEFIKLFEEKRLRQQKEQKERLGYIIQGGGKVYHARPNAEMTGYNLNQIGDLGQGQVKLVTIHNPKTGEERLVPGDSINVNRALRSGWKMGKTPSRSNSLEDYFEGGGSIVERQQAQVEKESEARARVFKLE